MKDPYPITLCLDGLAEIARSAAADADKHEAWIAAAALYGIMHQAQDAAVAYHSMDRRLALTLSARACQGCRNMTLSTAQYPCCDCIRYALRTDKYEAA